jgi:hypothetical protein
MAALGRRITVLVYNYLSIPWWSQERNLPLLCPPALLQESRFPLLKALPDLRQRKKEEKERK